MKESIEIHNMLTGSMEEHDYSCYLLLCGDDVDSDKPGTHVLSTRRTFATLDDAREHAKGIASSRQPIVVPCIFPFTITRANP